MPVVPMREILDRAFAERYGVAAINVVDDLSLEAVLAAATDLNAPLNTRQTIEVVAEANEHGAQVEGEIESVLGVEDGVGSDEASEIHPVEVSGEFIETTGIYSFAPAIGTAHGLYPAKQDPPSMLRHVRDAVKAMAEDHIRIFGSAGKASATSSAAA